MAITRNISGKGISLTFIRVEDGVTSLTTNLTELVGLGEGYLGNGIGIDDVERQRGVIDGVESLLLALWSSGHLPEHSDDPIIDAVETVLDAMEWNY